MLDPWIIEEIRRREEELRQREDQRSRLEIPTESPEEREYNRRPPRDPDSGRPTRDGERGVVIIDLSI